MEYKPFQIPTPDSRTSQASPPRGLETYFDPLAGVKAIEAIIGAQMLLGMKMMGLSQQILCSGLPKAHSQSGTQVYNLLNPLHDSSSWGNK